MEKILALVQTLLADDMAERNRLFAGQIRQLKAYLVKENMWSSSVAVTQMQNMAIDEFRVRQRLILQTWQRVLPTVDSVNRTLLLPKAAQNVAQALATERDYLENVVTSQPVGGLPNPAGFLSEVCGLATNRLQAELGLPAERRASDSLEERPAMEKTKGRRTPDLFLCHSHADKEFVRTLARDLHELSVYAWFDEWELLPGASLHDSIGRALEESSHVGVVISPESVESEWCNKELRQALSRETRQGKPIVVPLLFRSALIPPFLEDKLYIDFRTEYFDPITKLAGHLHGVDPKRLVEGLQVAPLRSLEDARNVLQGAGWKAAISVGKRDWLTLTDTLERHGVTVEDDYMSIFPGRHSKHRQDLS